MVNAQDWRPNWRIAFYQLLVVAAVVILAARLWRLQILHAQDYVVQADSNRFRLVSMQAPRGVIYDRKGRLLVRNVPSYTVSIVPGALPEDEVARRAVLLRLAQVLGIPVESKAASASGSSGRPGIEAILEQGTASPFSPVPILADVDRQLAFLIEEEHTEFPGVVVQTTPRREYMHGTLTSDVLGYVGPMPAESAQEYLTQTNADYTINDSVGVMGVETTFEKDLRGRKGSKHIEVNAFEREVNVLAVSPPQPGHNLILTIDTDLQQAAETALREGMYRVKSTAGVVVAMNPQTGEILAMVSLPSYDNNLFARGISSQDLALLTADPERPLLNHAIGGQYPPGSTFKVFPAAAALEEGVINRGTRLLCQGKLLLPNKYFPDDPTKAQLFRCWNPAGHGELSVVEGLALSCDIFFYQVGGGLGSFNGLGIEKLSEHATAFGFGEATGIALPGESSGLIPNDKWKRVNYGEAWVTGDTYNATIGQGYVLVTPLQLLNGTAAVANGGTLYRPQLVHQIVDGTGKVVKDFDPEVIRRVPVSAQNLDIVREGMRAAVTQGTAHRVNLREVAVAGKTGSAEYPGLRDAEGILPTHAWCTAFAPYDDPEIAVVIFVSGGHDGAKVAVPIAAQILRAYFGIPQPPGEDIVGPAPGD